MPNAADLVIGADQLRSPSRTIQEQRTGPGRSHPGRPRCHGGNVPSATARRWTGPSLRCAVMIVAFDADDTLWHNEDQFSEAHRAFASMLAEWAPADVVEARLHEIEIANLDRYGYGAKSFMLSMTETAIDLSGGAVPGTVVADILALGHEILDRPIELLADVTEVLPALAHHTLMLITKGDLYAQHARIAESGLADHFWRIEVVAEKDVATYARVLDHHRVDVDQFVMVGNSLRSDVLPVIELGGRGVHVPYAITWAHEADHDDHDHDIPRLERLGELPALLERWT
ncbi:MAG: HAD family hydrolase [Acidimicrobiales bacterium]